MQEYYVYIYLNPLRPSQYTIENDRCLLYTPFYVGYGKGQRAQSHLQEAGRPTTKRTNLHKIRTIRKIQAARYQPFILIHTTGLTYNEAQNLERRLIGQLGRSSMQEGPLTNLTDGGDGLVNPSVETRKRIADRPYRTGPSNPFYGVNAWKKWRSTGISSSTREKLRAAKLGKPGTPHTDEWKKEHSDRMQGSGNPNYGGYFGMRGKSHSKETRDLQSEKARKVSCIIDGIKYPSYKEAASMLGISYYAARYRAKREAQSDTSQ